MNNNKRELTVEEFINLSVIYEIVDFNLNVIADGLNSNFAEYFRHSLLEMYDLITSAVTLKNGKSPKYWNIKVSECKIAMSPQLIKTIHEKYTNFLETTKQNYYKYSPEEKIIVENLNDPRLDFAMEILRERFVEL